MKPHRLENVLSGGPPASDDEGPVPGPRPLPAHDPWTAPGRTAETDGRAEHAAMRLLGEQVPVLVWATDRDLRVVWGLKHPSFSGLDTRLSQALEAADPESPPVAAHRRALRGEAVEFEQSWEGRTFRTRVEPFRAAGGEVAGTVAVAVELDEEGRRAREELLRVSLNDPLTRLPNRAQLLDRLRRATAGGEWCRDGLFVLLVDVDGFSEVNARLGFEAGDRLLEAVATRLGQRVRPGDTLARYGADTFALLVTGVRSGSDAVRIARRLLRQMEPTFDVQGAALTATASVGIAAGSAGQRPEDILRDAERALRRAKLLGTATCQLFQPGRDAHEALLINLETALRRALDLEDFRSHYRPVVLRKDGKVAGFEILLWRRAPGGPEPARPAADPLRPAS